MTRVTITMGPPLAPVGQVADVGPLTLGHGELTLRRSFSDSPPVTRRRLVSVPIRHHDGTNHPRVSTHPHPGPPVSLPEPDWRRIFPGGPHRWTLGLRRGDLRAFFQPRDPTGDFLAERTRSLQTDPERYAACLPEARPALCETLCLAQSLGVATNSSDDLWTQLLHLGRHWEPDFTWMHPTTDSTHRLVGGVVCFPSSWSLTEKLGQPMALVHAPVPEMNPQLAAPIERLFRRLAPGEVWLRDNANFSRDPLWNHHPAIPRRRLDETIIPAEFWIRHETQLLMKLPESGCLLFAIRVDPYPLSRFLAEPLLATRLAEWLAGMTPAAAAYKGLTTARPKVLEWLGDAAR